MYISDFNYHRPKSLIEACTLLEECEDAAAIAGGTDMLVEIKMGIRHHQNIISLTEIEELKSIDDDSGNLFIGAGVTHNELINSQVVRESFPAIADAASEIGTEQIRNTGTIGGNLCTGASCCDMGPVLIALNAQVELAAHSKTRTLLLKDFFIFHKETSIKKGEIMTRIIVPHPQPGTGAAFIKFGLREEASISVASAAAAVTIKDGICIDACVVIGAVAPVPKISEKATEMIKGKNITELSESSSLLKQIGEAAAADSVPLDDIRGSAEYRKNLIKVLIQRAIVKAVERANKL